MKKLYARTIEQMHQPAFCLKEALKAHAIAMYCMGKMCIAEMRHDEIGEEFFVNEYMKYEYRASQCIEYMFN